MRTRSIEATVKVRAPLEGVEPDPDFDYAKAIRSVIKGAYEDATKAFGERQSGTNWLRLQTSMWALQAIGNEDGMREAVSRLPAIGVGHWVSVIGDWHKNKAEIR